MKIKTMINNKPQPDIFMLLFVILIGTLLGVIVGYKRSRSGGHSILPAAQERPDWNSSAIRTLLNENQYRQLDQGDRITLAQTIVLDLVTAHQNAHDTRHTKDLLLGALIGIDRGRADYERTNTASKG